MNTRYILAAALILGSMPSHAFQPSDYATGVTPKPDQVEFTQKAETIIKENLKDPDSAKFRGLFFSETPTHTPVLCGEINSKNSFGGYTGFQRMFVIGASDKMSVHFEDSNLFSVAWGKACAR